MADEDDTRSSRGNSPQPAPEVVMKSLEEPAMERPPAEVAENTSNREVPIPIELLEQLIPKADIVSKGLPSSRSGSPPPGLSVEPTAAALNGPLHLFHEPSRAPNPAEEVLLPIQSAPVRMELGHSVDEPMKWEATPPLSGNTQSAAAFLSEDPDSEDEDNPHPPNGSLELNGSGYVPRNKFKTFDVPGAWVLRAGSQYSEVLEFDFFVDPTIFTAIQRWGNRHNTFDPKESHIAVGIVCVPSSTAAKLIDTLPPNVTGSDLAAGLAKLATRWPKRGTLIVDLNHGRPDQKVWMPTNLGPEQGALDVSPLLHAGWNEVRFIQLDNMEKYVYMLHAWVPSDGEKQQVAKHHTKQNLLTSFLEKTITSGRLQ